jgi:hypothetical protein
LTIPWDAFGCPPPDDTTQAVTFAMTVNDVDRKGGGRLGWFGDVLAGPGQSQLGQLVLLRDWFCRRQ